MDPPGARPSEACLGPRRRAVLAADPPLVSQLVDEGEEPCVVELARIGLQTVRRARYLDVADVAVRAAAEVRLQLLRHPALDDLAVVEVELHLDVRGAYLDREGVRVGLTIEGIAGIVARIERLDEQGDAGLRRPRRRGPEVGNEGGPALLIGRIRGRNPPHRVQPRTAGRPAVAERELHRLPKLRLAPR